MRKVLPWFARVLVLLVVACEAGDGMVISGTGGSAGEGAGGRGGFGGIRSGGSGGTSGDPAGAGGDSDMQTIAGAGGNASAGMGASGGMGASSGMGASGGGGGQSGFTAPPVMCTDSDASYEGTLARMFDHATHGFTTGLNGMFEDRCDADGNLIEQVCETAFGCGGGGFNAGACAPRELPTGNVIERPVDCLGQCMDGACRIACPEVGDLLEVEVIDLAAQRYALIPAEGPNQYLCTLSACAAGTGDAQLSVTSFAEARSDCLGTPVEFGPLTLSNGCDYFNCVAALKEPSP
jgi:hypothetical protein